MLTNAKAVNDKIILGLLGYTFHNESHSYEDIEELYQQIKDNNCMDIFLYKQPETDNCIGILIIETNTVSEDNNQSKSIMIHRYGVVPSFMDDHVELKMYSALKQHYPHTPIIGALDIANEVSQWEQLYQQQFQE